MSGSAPNLMDKVQKSGFFQVSEVWSDLVRREPGAKRLPDRTRRANSCRCPLPNLRRDRLG